MVILELGRGYLRECSFVGWLISLPCFFSVSLFTELSLITLHWFLTSFASVVHIKLLLRIWDLFFYQGSVVLFQVTLGMLSMKVISTFSSSLVF